MKEGRKEKFQKHKWKYEKCSGSLAIMEIHIKSTLRFHLMPVRLAYIWKFTNNTCAGKKSTPLHCWWECRLMQPLWESVWSVLKQLKSWSTAWPSYPTPENISIGSKICRWETDLLPYVYNSICFCSVLVWFG